MTKRMRTAILISGRGSNMVSLLEAAQASDYPARIDLVLSNRPEAGGIAKAKQSGIATSVVDHKAFSGREAFEQAMDDVLRAADIELVCLAGFMRVLTPGFVAGWEGRMLNIHPSLLPLFKGTQTHRQALEAGVRVHGCTVHFVVPELDSGPIVAQSCVPVHPGDTEAALAERVLVEEHRIYPRALADVAAGRAVLRGGRCVFPGA